MSLDFFSSVSLYLSLALIGAILAFFLAVGIAIMNAKGLALTWRPAIKYIVALALLLCLTLFMLYRYMSELPLRKAESLLEAPNVEVLVDGDVKHIEGELLRAFRERTNTKISGSEPTNFFSLAITVEEQSLIFRLGQDSRDEDLFWVYFPRYENQGSLCYIEVDPSLFYE